MPELPEVETVRRGLQKRLKGFVINTVNVYRARAIASKGGIDTFIDLMNGSEITCWERRGKYLIAKLQNQVDLSGKEYKKQDKEKGWLVVHLRMTGHFEIREIAIPPCRHTRVSFTSIKGEQLSFIDIRSFGQMWAIPPNSSPESMIKGLGALGPEPFDSDFNPQYLIEKLRGKSRPIKTALLDQSLIAGIGNIYADESLFLAGIAPYKKSGELSEVEIQRLCKSIIKVLKISIGKGGTTFKDFRDLEGLNGNYGGEAWVYRRANKACRKCGAKIVRQKINGRGTHWCKSCQKS